jgi:hypothetical protein
MRSSGWRQAIRCLALGAGFSAALLALAAPAIQAALAPMYEGELYEVGSARKHLLFRYKVAESPDRQVRRAEYTDAQGTLVATEEVEMRDFTLVRYAVDHPLAKRGGSLERRGGELVFHTRSGSSEDETRQKFSDDVLVGSMLVPWVHHHWKRLRGGEKIPIRLASLEREDTFGFEVGLEGEVAHPSGPAVRLAVRPTSFLVAALTSPVLFVISADGETVYEIAGPTTALRRDGDDFESTDVDGVYRKVGG